MLPGTWGAGPGLEPGSDPVPGRDAGSCFSAGSGPAQARGYRRLHVLLQREDGK